MADVVIVGAGHGGAQCAIALRQAHYEGSILMIGDEDELPYDRPSLSKDYLLKEKTFDRIKLRPDDFWGKRDIAIETGRRIALVNPKDKTVTDTEGRETPYGKLVWATGGKPRYLPCDGSDLKGIHAIRTRADVDGLMGELDGVEDVVIIGGGYIGLEAAAALSIFGKKVVVLEARDRVLARVAGEELSRFYERQHRKHGVDVQLGVVMSHFVADAKTPDRVGGVELSGGKVLPAQMVIVGIGISPRVRPLTNAGAEGGNGVNVNANCETSIPDVYAIGDCAAHENSYAEGRRIRLESVQNANDQAITVARAIAGTPEPYNKVPWFWSDQYDLKLQTVGISQGYDQVVVRGDPESDALTCVYLRQGKVIALDCVNTMKDYVAGRKLVVGGVAADPAKLADPAVALKTLA